MRLNILIHVEDFFLQPDDPDAKVFAPIIGSILACNDHNFKKENFYLDHVVQYIGSRTTLSDCDFGFSLIEIPEDDNPFDLAAVRKIVHQTLSYTAIYFEEFLTYLWFAKDHSASSNLSVAFIDGYEETLVAMENRKSTTMADGTQSKGFFSKEDFSEAIEIIQKINQIYKSQPLSEIVTPINLDDKGQSIPTTIRTFANHTPYYKFNRIQRALSLLSILRGISFLPYKLSMYIPILESLFSPSDGELTFKVSQRVGFYLGSNMAEARAIFEQVKRVYEIRSRYLHGQPFEKKSIKLDFKEESKNMDDILRRILKKVILFDSDIFLSDEVEKKLNDLVFGVR